MTINGLPAHALIIHAAVVFGPLAALFALGYVGVPRLRSYLRWPMVAVALMGSLAVVAAYFSGKSFLKSTPDLAQLPAVQTHASRADTTLWVVIAFGLVAVFVGARHARSGGLRIAGDALLAVLAVATLAMVMLTGDAGAQAVWGSGS